MFHIKDVNPNRPYVFLVQCANHFAVECTLIKTFNNWQNKTDLPFGMAIAWVVHPESVMTPHGLECPENHPPEMIGSFHHGRFQHPC